MARGTGEPRWQKQLIIGEHGDCLRAAFANCLNLPIASLPHFEDAAWFDRWCAWFRERGIGLIWYGFRPGILHTLPGLYVLSVKSQRLPGRTHCVVARDGEIVFDPHPHAECEPSDPSTANGAYLFHLLDPEKFVHAEAQ
jgi:hypothetical protein